MKTGIDQNIPSNGQLAYVLRSRKAPVSKDSHFTDPSPTLSSVLSLSLSRGFQFFTEKNIPSSNAHLITSKALFNEFEPIWITNRELPAPIEGALRSR